MSLSLKFFNSFQASSSGHAITKFRAVKVQGLLVYLALEADKAHARDVLATLFWPEEPDTVAKKNLRQSLYQLRRVLGDSGDEGTAFLHVTRQTVQFNTASEYQLDVDDFLAATAQDDMETAVILYRGELLPGFTCDSLQFEGWLLTKRETFHRLALDALYQLTEQYLENGNLAAAQQTARRQITFEPWREEAHRQLMIALAQQGERSAALAQYDICRQVLWAEIAVEPDDETEELWARIDAGKDIDFAPKKKQSPPPVPFQAASVPPHFVGREPLLQAAVKLLTRTSEQINSVALVGMGGVGKTSLAAALALHLKDHFKDGVLWGNPRTSETEHILEVWGRAYGHDYSNLPDLRSRATAVRGLLAYKQTLIILDNVDDAAKVRALLPSGSNCALLLTTRNSDVAAALNCQTVPVVELSPASSQNLLANILGKERITATPAETAATVKIGALLHYLPLAVEIAAQLLKSRSRMSLTMMAARLEDAQQRLGLAISDRAVRASFHVSWDMLDTQLRHIFACVAVFDGRPFSPKALAAVIDRDLFAIEDALYTLTALSLLREEGTNQYKQHPLLADFAAEKLDDAPRYQTRMADYYLGFVHTHNSDFDALDPEWGNISAAIETAHQLTRWQMVLDFTDVLAESWIRYGRMREADQAYVYAQEAAERLQDDVRLAKTLLRRTETTIESGSYNQAWEQLRGCYRLYYQLEDDYGIAQTQYLQGYVLFDQGRFAEAEKVLNASLAIFEDLSDVRETAVAQRLLARVYLATDKTSDRAAKTAKEVLQMQEPLGDEDEIISVLRLLSTIEIRRENLTAAEAYAARAIELSIKTQNLAEKGAAYYLLIMIFRMRKAFAKAEKVIQECLEIFQYLGNRRYEAMILHELSVNYLAVGKYPEAQQITSHTLDIFRQTEDRLGYGYALRQRGDIYLRLGETEKSQQSWREAQQMAQQLGFSHLLGQLDQRLEMN